MAATPEQSTKTYRGNCHCKAFVYETQLPEISVAYSCNCSICVKKGYLWNFPPTGIKFVKGDDKDLVTYGFNTKTTLHKFCGHCGTPLFGYKVDPSGGEPKVGVNVRCIQGLDTWTIETKSFDGRALEPQYKPPQFTGPEPTVDIDGAELYTGGCHCGAVTLAVKTKPLDKSFEGPVMECNCNLCQRFAYTLFGPNENQVSIDGKENLTEYQFEPGNGKLYKKFFCKKCGVHVGEMANDMNEDELAALSEPARKFREMSKGMFPIALRALNDFDMSQLKEPTRHDGLARPPAYVNP